MRRPVAVVVTALALAAAPVPASYLERTEVNGFVDELVARHQFDMAELQALFRAVRQQPRVLEAIARPAERKPWREYRPIFVTESRISEGAAFWDEHAALLDAIAAESGVPASIMVAILGVETRYGRYRGRFPALDTLTTLAFDYPPRGGFFRRELEQFLLLVRDEGLDPRRVSGSYAAAMGMPQFIASSYRQYAVDYDDDGRRDLWNSTGDVLASVANYFRRHGWRQGQPVVARARAGSDYQALLSDGLKPTLEHGQVQPLLEADAALDAEGPYSVMELDGADGAEVWVGSYNFYVITRYNHSRLYALAVYQLSQAIAQRRAAGS